VPDVAAADNGSEFWIEGKIARSGRVKFQPGQVPWLIAASMAGRRAWVVVGTTDGVSVYSAAAAHLLARRPLKEVHAEISFPHPVNYGLVWDWLSASSLRA